MLAADSLRVSGRTLKQRLVSGGAWTFGGRVVAALSGFAVNAMLARLLSLDDMGAYFLILSVVAAGVMTAQLGMHTVVVRLIAEALAHGRDGRARGIVSTSATLVFCGGIVLGVVAALFVRFGAQPLFGSAAMAQGAWLAGLWIFSIALMTLIGEIFRGFHDYGAAAAFGPAGNNTVVAIVIGGVFVSGASAGLHFALAAGLAASTAIALAGAATLRRRCARLAAPEPAPAGPLLAVGLPLLVASLAVFAATQADVWIIGLFRGPDDVAVYGAAVRLVQFVMMPMLVMNAVLAPLVSELHSQGNRVKLERVVRGCAALTGIPAALVLAVLFGAAEPILGLAYGDFYRTGASVLILVSAGQVVNILAGPAAVVLMMSGSQRALMAISLACASLVVLGGWAAVGPYGTIGVAAAAALGTGLHGVLSWLWVRRALGIWTHFTLSDLNAAARALVRRPG